MKPNQPIGVRERAQVLPATCFRTLVWREGTNAPLSSRFARARVRVRAHRPTDSDRKNGCSSNGPRVKASRPDIFCPPWLQNVPFKKLVSAVKMRWRIERDYRKLKQEVGLGHYEGRNWRGFHHHASLCIAAYGFLMLEQPSGAKKNSARLKMPPVPEGFRPRGTRPDAPAHPVVDIDRAFSLGSAIARVLPQCPCCGKPFVWGMRNQ